MKRFCTRRNEAVEIQDVKGNPTCISYGMETDCTEARCKYSLAATMRAALLGSSGPGFPDYTTELKEAPAGAEAADKGPSKICDICSKPVYRQDAYIFDTKTVLASDKYADFVIQEWVRKGLLPSSATAFGIDGRMRDAARDAVKKQAGGTPWLVCKSCLPMFSVKEKDLEKAKKRADDFWK